MKEAKNMYLTLPDLGTRLLVGSLFMVYPSARYHKRTVYLLA